MPSAEVAASSLAARRRASGEISTSASREAPRPPPRAPVREGDDEALEVLGVRPRRGVGGEGRGHGGGSRRV
jgi:hypothetical protein